MKEVTIDYFFDKIGPLDVVVSTENVYAKSYVSLFKDRRGNLLGKIKPVVNENGYTKYPVENIYLLNL